MRAKWNVMGVVALVATLVAASAAQATVLTMEGDVSASANVAPPPAGGNTYGPLGGGSTIVSEYGDFVSGPTQTNVPTADFGAPPFWYNFTYGNNGEGYTPNVSVAKRLIYPTADPTMPNINTATRSWPSANGRQFVSYPAAGTTNGGSWYWTFTADPGYLVTLLSTDLTKFTSAALTATVNVYAGSTVTLPVPIAPVGPALYTSGPTVVSTLPVTFTPNVTAPSLTLEFVLPAGASLSGNWAADNLVFSQKLIPEPATLGLAATGLLALAVARRRRR